MNTAKYVFEILENEPVFPGCVGFRRADLESVEAREALILLLQSQFQIEIDQTVLDESLKGVSAEWQFLKAAPPPIPFLMPVLLLVAQMEREPGKNSGENPVITSAKQIQQRLQ